MVIRRRSFLQRPFVGYVRVSSRRARDLLQVQEDTIRSYVEERRGRMARVFSDIGPFDNSNLKGRERAIQYAIDHDATLIVTRICRLSRFSNKIMDWSNDGVRILATEYPGASIEDLQAYAFRALALQIENDEDRELAQIEAEQSGRAWGGAAVNNEARRLATDQFASHLYIIIRILLRKGPLSNNAIASELNRLGVRTRFGRGRWHSKTVGRMLDRVNRERKVRLPNVFHTLFLDV